MKMYLHKSPLIFYLIYNISNFPLGFDIRLVTFFSSFLHEVNAFPSYSKAV